MMNTTWMMVEKNLRELIGCEFDTNNIICSFGDFEEFGESEVIVKESENNGYDAIAYINACDSTQFLFRLVDGIIEDVWVA